jgi:tetratricopeptide (TPR) repeat protein
MTALIRRPASHLYRRLRRPFLKRITLAGVESRYDPWRPNDSLHVARSLLEEGRTDEAEAILVEATARFPRHDWLATTYGELLNRQERWDEALIAWRREVIAFPDHPPAVGGLSVALERTGQAEAADQLVSEAAERFAGEYWLRLRHADLACLRGDAHTAVARWRSVAADFPDEPYPQAQLANWLRRSGQPAQALEGLRPAADRWPDDAFVMIVALEVALDVGALEAARLYWWKLRTGDPGPFAGALLHQSWRLFLALDSPAERAEALAFLLAEPADTAPDWRPTIVVGAQFLTFDAFSERVRAEIRAMIETSVPPAERTLVHRLAWSAAGGAIGRSEAEANLRSAFRATAWVAQVLLDDWTFPGRTPAYAAAAAHVLPELVDGELASPAPGRDALLLALKAASVFDRPTFATLLHRCAEFLPELAVPDPTGLAGLVRAHQRPTGPPRRGGGDRLKIAVCVSGQMRGYRDAFSSWARLGLQSHDVRYFVDTWRRLGAKPPAHGHAHRSFEPAFAAAFIEAASRVGVEALMARYPRLAARLERVVDLEVDEEEVRALYGAAAVRVEDDAEERFAGRSNAWKMHYKIRQAHQLAVASGEDFDLILRIRPDREVAEAASLDWRAIAHRCHAERLLLADEGRHFHSLVGYFIGDQFALGAPAAMDQYASTFDVVEHCAATGEAIGGLPAEHVPHASLAHVTFAARLAVEQMPAVRLGDLKNASRIPTAELQRLLEADTAARERDDLDEALLRSCRQEAG